MGAVDKPPAKILRVLGNPDPVLERTHIGIYDYLDQLSSLAFRQAVTVQTPIQDVAAYTTIQAFGTSLTKRRLANFGSVFGVTDSIPFERTNIDINLFSPGFKGVVPPSGGGTVNFLRADGSWVAPGGGITQLTGDVTAGPGTGSQAATIAAHAVTNGKLRQSSARSVVGNSSSVVADVVDITASFGSDLPLRESAGTIGFGQLTTGAYGTNTVTYSKLQQTTTGDVLLGNGGIGAGAITELGMSGEVSVSAGAISWPKQTSMTWGGFLFGVGTQLATVPFYLGIGDNSWSTASSFGLPSPTQSRGFSQQWAVNVFANTLVGTGSPTFSVELCVNGTPVAILGTFSGSGSVPSVQAANTFQPWSVGDRLGIQIAVATGTINAGNLGIYVVGRFLE